MALNIKNAEVERLVDEISSLTGSGKTETIRRALLEQKERLSLHVNALHRGSRIKRFLETEIWPQVPEAEKGRRLTRQEEDTLLGFGDAGI